MCLKTAAVHLYNNSNGELQVAIHIAEHEIRGTVTQREGFKERLELPPKTVTSYQSYPDTANKVYSLIKWVCCLGGHCVSILTRQGLIKAECTALNVIPFIGYFFKFTSQMLSPPHFTGYFQIYLMLSLLNIATVFKSPLPLSCTCILTL